MSSRSLDLSAPWTDRPLAVVDFETTSQDAETAIPVTVAVARFESGVLVGGYSTPLDPGVAIPLDATEIHGITDAEVRGAPAANDLGLVLADSRVRHLHEDAIPCAYNVPYERTILRRLVNASAFNWPMNYLRNWIDVLVLIRDIDKYVPGKGRYTLEKACERWGVSLGNAHNALADSIATGQLLFALLSAGKVAPCSIAELLRQTAEMEAEQTEEYQRYKANPQKTEGIASWLRRQQSK